MFFNSIRKPVILSVYNLKSDLRVFHTNRTYFVRKLISKHSSIDPEIERVEKDIEPRKPEDNPNVNFLGIEGDEGVIVISDHKHSTHITDFKKPDIRTKKEKFFKTTFGIIRSDSQNKIRYHGQYDNREISEFPHFSHEQTEVSNIQTNPEFKTISSFFSDVARTSENYSNKYGSDFDQNFESYTENYTLNINDLPISDMKQSRHNKDACFCPELSVDESKDQNDISKDLKSSHASVSYIDESFFGNAVKEEKENLNPQTSIEDLSYIDQQIFGDVSFAKDAEFNKNIKLDANSEQFSNTEKSFRNSSHTGKDIFQSNTQICHKNVSITDQHVKDDCNSIIGSFSNVVEDLGYVDQQMFKRSELLANNIISEQNLNREKFNQTLTDLSSNKEDIILNKSGTIKNPIQDKSAFDKEKRTKYEYNDEKLSLNERHNKTSLNNFETSSHLADFESSKQVINNIKVRNTYFDKVIETSDPKLTNANHVKSKKLLPKMKDSSEATDESNDTAFDYVEKLRKEQTIKSIRKAPVLGQDQFDSKGFRILKNQVQDLSNITRDEIITILKQNILYSDDDLVILNKPYGLVMHESGTTSNPCLSQLLDGLATEIDAKRTDSKLYTVHRLDKETTGCLILARNEEAADNLKALFAQRKIIKKYWILTSRIPDPLKGVIDIPIAEGTVDSKTRMVLDPNLPKDINYKNHSKRGKRAVTAYQVISISGNAALVEVTPETGIKHQIRVHFGFGLSCPIIGDHKYSHLDKMAPQKLASDLLQRLNVRQSKVRHIPMHIHAHSVTIPGHLDGRDLFMMAPLPYHMRANLIKLKFKRKNKLRL